MAEVNLSEASMSIGFQALNGQSQITDDPSVTLWEVPVSLVIKQSNFNYGVQLKQVKLESKEGVKQGMGDAVFSLGYHLNKQFQISLKEKIPATSSSKYLTTGVNETSVQLDFSAPMIKANRRLFATMGYTFTDKSSKYKLQNRSYLSLGTRYLLKSKTKIGVSLDYKENIFADLDNQLGLQAYIDQPINSTYNLSAFAGYDRSQTSSIGVTLSGKF